MKKSVLIVLFLILLIVPIAFAFSLGGKEVFSLNKAFNDFFNKISSGITGKIVGATCTTKVQCSTGEICKGVVPYKKCALCSTDGQCTIQYGSGYTCVSGTCTSGGAGGGCTVATDCTTPITGDISCNTPTCSAGLCSYTTKTGSCIKSGVYGTCDTNRICVTCTDDDQDGFGLSGSTGCSHTGVDCDDTDSSINPSLGEICDNTFNGIGIDDNCDGLINCEDTTNCPSCSAGQVCDTTTAHTCIKGSSECTNDKCDLGATSYQKCELINGIYKLAVAIECPAGQTCSSSGKCMAGDPTKECANQPTTPHNHCSAASCPSDKLLQHSGTDTLVCCSVACSNINYAPYFINITTFPANTTTKEAELSINATVTLNDPNLGNRLNISFTWYEGGTTPPQFKVNISNKTGGKFSIPNATNKLASITWIVLRVPYNLTNYSLGRNYTLGVYACDGELCNQTNSSRINITTTAGLSACTTPNIICTASLPSCTVDHQVAHSGTGICCSQACTAPITCTPACAGETPTCDSVSGVCKCTSTSCGSGKICNSAGACETTGISSTTAGCTVGSGATERIIPVGTRTGIGTPSVNSFCNIDYTWVAQKIIDVPCQNDYECVNNVCKGNKCVDISKVIENVGLLKQIWCKITHPTNNDAYNCCTDNPFGSTGYDNCIDDL